MSIQAVRPYITEQLSALNLSEHTDPFNDENIPSNIIDGAFHQMLLPFSGVDKNNVSQGIEAPVQVKVFFKGYRTPEDALTQSIIKAEEIMVQVLKTENYFNYNPPITAVFLDSLEFAPYDEESNDNTMMVIFVFRFKLYVCIE
jgi:hypothetical protein